jgi:hypothetical protein
MSTLNILALEQLAAIKRAFQGSSLILEHAYMNGGRAPDSIVVDDYEDLEEYLRTKVAPGDILSFWRYNDLCRHDTAVVIGKYPRPDGTVPPGGAY